MGLFSPSDSDYLGAPFKDSPFPSCDLGTQILVPCSPALGPRGFPIWEGREAQNQGSPHFVLFPEKAAIRWPDLVSKASPDAGPPSWAGTHVAARGAVL